MRSIRSTPTGGGPFPGFGENGSHLTPPPAAPPTAPPPPSRQEMLPAASSWRSAQTPLPPASTASSPDPMQQSTPPDIINDFVFGAMHEGLRQLLFDGLGTVADAIPLAQLPPPRWPVSANGIEKLEARLPWRATRPDRVSSRSTNSARYP